MKSEKWFRFFCILGVVLFTAHLFSLITYSINVPYVDEWGGYSFHADAQTRAFNPAFMLRFHNEHRIVLTKFQAWIFNQWKIFNFNTIVVFNFLFYLAMTACFFAFLARKYTRYVIFAFPIFATGLIHENHYHAFQGQFHFALTGFIAACILAFSKKSWHWLAVPAIVASCYSFSAGVIWSACFLVVLAYLGLTRKKMWKSYFVMGLIVALMTALWFIGYQPTPAAPQGPMRPLQLNVWLGWLEILGAGFGVFDHARDVYGALVVSATAYILGILYVRRRELSNDLRDDFALVAFILMGLFSAIWLISFGRSTSDTIAGAYVPSRYIEFSIFVLPLFLVLLVTFLKKLKVSKRFLRRSVILFALACWIPFASTYEFRRFYKPLRQQKLELVHCIREYYAGSGSGVCNIGIVADISAHLDYAKEIRLPFAEENQPP